MKKIILGFIFGMACAIGGSVYGVTLFTSHGFIVQPVQNDVPVINIVTPTQDVAPRNTQIQYGLVSEESQIVKQSRRISELETRVSALELKIK